MAPRLSLIAAVAANGVIGRDNRLPWRLPADLAHFKTTTMGRPLLMGRRTFQSLPALLPGRPHVVISHDLRLAVPKDVRLVATLEDGIREAGRLAGVDGEIMVIGGAQIYAQALPLADRLYLTEVHAAFDGDAVFPVVDPRQWHEVSRHEHGGAPAFAFVVMDRTSPV